MGPLVAVQDELLPCLPIVVGQVDFLKFSSFVLYTFFFSLKSWMPYLSYGRMYYSWKFNAFAFVLFFRWQHFTCKGGV